MAMKKKMKGNITSPALPGKSILAEVNNNEAGNIYNSLFAKNRKVEYDNKYIGGQWAEDSYCRAYGKSRKKNNGNVGSLCVDDTSAS